MMSEILKSCGYCLYYNPCPCGACLFGVCHCASRTIARVIHGDICVSYLEVSE